MTAQEVAELAQIEAVDGDVRAMRISDETIHRHDETILANINAVVGERDVLWHLGDFAMGRHSFFRHRSRH